MIIRQLKKLNFFTKRKIEKSETLSKTTPLAVIKNTSYAFLYKKQVFDGLNILQDLQIDLLENGMTKKTSDLLKKIYKEMESQSLENNFLPIYKETKLKIAVELAKVGVFI